jgi:DNA invertase Pin-like site-specific DNA recombinase
MDRMTTQNTQKTLETMRFNPIPDVYSYTRFSTAIQKKGTGQRRQNEAAVKWCETKNLPLKKDYADLGVSAFKGKNVAMGELAAFLECVESRRIKRGSILIVESLDRLSRNNINIAMELLLRIINAGIIVVTLCDNAEYRDDMPTQQLMGQLMYSLAIFARANDESAMKSDRKGKSWKYKREAALKNGTPLGGNTPAWIEVRDGKYRVIESVAAKVRAIFRDYNGGAGVYLLNKRHDIPKPTILYWLTNPIVIGTVQVKESGHKLDIPNHYPAIIDAATWKLAQQRKAERKIIPSRRGRAGWINLFTGLLVGPNGKRFDVQRHYGFSSYVQHGFVIQARPLELAIVTEYLRAKFVETVYTEETAPTERLNAINAKINQIQDAMKDDNADIQELLPVLRAWKEKRTAEIGKDKVMKQCVSERLIQELGHAKELDTEEYSKARARLREMVRDTIKQVRIRRADMDNWYSMLSGEIVLHNDEIVPFRIAYCSRRVGFVRTDGGGIDPRTSTTFRDLWKYTPIPLDRDTIDEDVIRQLKKLPTRRELNDEASREIHREQLKKAQVA